MSESDNSRCDFHGWQSTSPARSCPSCLKIEAEVKQLKDELFILKNPSDGRCMEIGVLREEIKRLRAQMEQAREE